MPLNLVSFIEYKAIQSHSKSFRNIPRIPNTSSKSGQRLMGSQERVGEDKYDNTFLPFVLIHFKIKGS
jgi:hypothetical protein